MTRNKDNRMKAETKIKKEKRIAFEKEIFKELRSVLVDDKGVLSNESLQLAMTVNEELNTIGYTLTVDGLLKVARAKNIKIVRNKIKDFLPEIKANPMYPKFPEEVLAMDEAQFRFEQMLHYFSTYGVEALFGIEVLQGWLPNEKELTKTEAQKKELPYKVIDAYTDIEIFEKIKKSVILKSERFTIPEALLATYVVTETNTEIEEVPFKENIYVLVAPMMDTLDTAYVALKKVCKHTGDVFKFLQTYMSEGKIKNLPTSKKRMFVNLLESYPEADFLENIYPSKAGFVPICRLLERLSYNRFSKKSGHKEIVVMARDKQIQTWMSKLEAAIESKEDKEILHIAKQRPGMLLRMLNRLIKLGVDTDALTLAFKEVAPTFKMQTLISVLNYMEQSENKEATLILREAMKVKMQLMETPLKGKKVFINEGIYDFATSTLEFNEKSEEGGYIRSGLSFKIPENIDILRFFVYWNHSHHTDIDLHQYLKMLDESTAHVGWNGSFRENGIVFSGDITHSDAAEYIDIDLSEAKETGVSGVACNVTSYTGLNFNEFDTLFTGMMGVTNDLTGKMKLHDVKNEFFRHDLRAKVNLVDYCFIDVQNRVMRLLGQQKGGYTNISLSGYFLDAYISDLLEAQQVVTVDNKEDADIILSLDKGMDEKSISLIDENYFI